MLCDEKRVVNMPRRILFVIILYGAWNLCSSWNFLSTHDCKSYF